MNAVEVFVCFYAKPGTTDWAHHGPFGTRDAAEQHKQNAMQLGYATVVKVERIYPPLSRASTWDKKDKRVT